MWQMLNIGEIMTTDKKAILDAIFAKLSHYSLEDLNAVVDMIYDSDPQVDGSNLNIH